MCHCLNPRNYSKIKITLHSHYRLITHAHNLYLCMHNRYSEQITYILTISVDPNQRVPELLQIVLCFYFNISICVAVYLLLMLLILMYYLVCSAICSAAICDALYLQINSLHIIVNYHTVYVHTQRQIGLTQTFNLFTIGGYTRDSNLMLYILHQHNQQTYLFFRQRAYLKVIF